ncbi:MAG: hypothetical protein GY694_23035, partial [Gammaproteobacteria bacterium]|nr:hypothetical protein [Gammaproteobacteria bacterium]
MDLFDATSMLEAALTSIKNARDKFEDIKIEAVTLARTWGTDTKFKQKRISRKKRLFDELCEDERLTDAEQHFKTSVYYTCMDTVISQLTCRFEGMRTVAERFRCIHSSALLADDDDRLHAQGQNLAITYNQDLSVDFPKQLLSFRNIMKSKIEKLSKATIKDLAEMLMVKHSSIMTCVPDVITVFKIFLTLPVTVASAERSFSKLKLIKNYMS